MEGKIDRRVVKTKERLYQVFIQLLAQKPVKDITVKELSEGADINRATFYLHYNDVFDLLEQIEAEIYEYFTKLVANMTPSYSDYEFMSNYIKLLDYISERKELCKVLLCPNGDPAFFDKIVRIVIEKCMNGAVYTQYALAFCVAGCVGVTTEWIRSGMEESPEMVAGYALSMIKELRS